MQLGMRRLRGLLGWRLGGYVLVLLPVLCATLNLLVGDGRPLAPSQVPYHEVVLPFARFYPPCVVSTCLLAFIGTSGEERHGTARVASGALSLVLVSPYALLIAVLAFGLEAAWRFVVYGVPPDAGRRPNKSPRAPRRRPRTHS